MGRLNICHKRAKTNIQRTTRADFVTVSYISICFGTYFWGVRKIHVGHLSLIKKIEIQVFFFFFLPECISPQVEFIKITHCFLRRSIVSCGFFFRLSVNEIHKGMSAFWKRPHQKAPESDFFISWATWSRVVKAILDTFVL